MAASPSTPLVPPPVSSPSPSLSQPNATSNPPSPSNSFNTSASPPPQSTQSSAPPPISLPPPPLQISVSPPPEIPPIVSPPPPSLTSPSPVSAPPSPSILSPPLPPPPGTPPSSQPPISTSPPPTLSPSPPSPPPQLAPPPIPIAPTLPSSPPSPSSAKPTSPIPVPPTPTPSTNSPAIPSSAPPPSTQPIATPPSSPNSSTRGTPPKKPLPSPATPSGKLTPPVSHTPSNSSNSPPNDTTPSGNVNSAGSGGIGTGIVVAISIIAFLVVLSFSILVVWVLKKKRRRGAVLGGGYVIPSAYGSPDMSDSSFLKTPPSSAPLFGKGSCGSELSFLPSEPGGLGYSRSLFTYEELLGATNGFSEQNLLGEGGFGPVYKGCLPDGREVAVKQLKVGGSQGEREFRAEVEIISRVHHRHLVSLVGYCISEHQRLLVYVYVPNSTLYYHVHGKGGPVLDWGARVKIAAGAARGIAYLHEDCQPRIIHRDIKSSNILLDKNFEAQVSDFGLAKLAQDSFTHISTRVMGTFGYMAPEYVSSGKLTEKSDVFSFGVVLLELVTGREPVDASQSLGDESLVEWARPLLTQALDGGDFEGLVDPRLQTNYVKSELFRVMEVAAACVRYTAGKRPRMGQVVRALDGVADLFDLNNGMKPDQSELFNAAQQSAEIRLFQRMAFGAQDYSIDFSQTRSVDREI